MRGVQIVLLGQAQLLAVPGPYCRTPHRGCCPDEALGPQLIGSGGGGGVGVHSFTPWNSASLPGCPRPTGQDLGSPLHSSIAGPRAQRPPRSQSFQDPEAHSPLWPPVSWMQASPFCLRSLATLVPPAGSCFVRMKTLVTALLELVQFCSVDACPSQHQPFVGKDRAVLSLWRPVYAHRVWSEVREVMKAQIRKQR